MKTLKTLAVAFVAVAALMATTRNASAQTTTQTLSSLPNFDPGTGPQARVDALTVTLDPLGGALHGKGGDILGWGFKISWESNAGDYLVFTGSRLSSEVSALSTTGYQDIIGMRSGPVSAAFPANTTWQQPFVAGSTGIGGLTLKSGAVGGAEFSGQIRLSFDVFDDFPDYGEKLGSFVMVVDATVTVDMPPPAPPADQSITFDPIGTKTFGAAPFTISASAAGALPVTFTSETAAVCTVSDATVTLASAGTCTITATQDGDDAYNAAPPVSQSFEVTKAAATVTLTGALSTLYDGTPKSLTASTTPGGLNVLVTYNGDSSAPTAAGTYQVMAIIDDPAYDGTASATMTIAKAAPSVSWTAPGSIIYGTALTSDQLHATSPVPGTFDYQPALGTVLTAGQQTLSVTFTPTDQQTFSSVTTTVSLSVDRRPLTITAASVTQSHTAPYPVFTGTITNGLAGDALVATYTAAPTTVPGAYAIVPALVANAASPNYAVTPVNGTLTLTNAAPVAVNNSYSGSWNGPLTVAAPGVRANDTDADGDALTVALVAGPTRGTVALNADGSFVYTPAANYTGADSFTYRVSDGYATSNIATVSLTVTSPCRVDRDGKSEADDCARGTAIAKNDRYVAAQNTTLTVSAPNVLTNDGPFAQSAVLVTNAVHGTVTLAANGAFTYVPATGYYGLDTFQYTARNTAGVAGPAATVTLIVRANLAPDADDDVYATSRNTKLTVSVGDGVLDNDSDPENDAIAAQVVTGPAHGTLAFNANGGFVYTPTAGYTGVDTFTYTARDPFGHTDVATVRIYVGVSRGNDRGGSKHKDNDDCDHERGRNGHFKGDGCEHDRGGL